MACRRITGRGQNPYSSARACAAPEGPGLDAGTCACDDARACVFAGLPADTNDGHASCSPASPHDGASRGYAGTRSGASHARSPGSASAVPTDLGLCSCNTNRRARTVRAESPYAHSPSSAPESIGPARDGALASELFSDHLAEDVFIEREVGHQALEARVLIAQLAELADLGEPELRVLLLPEVKARLAHAELPADIRHGRPAFGLAQRVGDLLVGKSLALHGPLLPLRRTSEVSL